MSEKMQHPLAINLSGKKAIVTGAGRGIGKAIAFQLAAVGAHVVCVSRSESSCGSAAEEIKAAGGSAEALAVDVGDAAAVKAAGAKIIEAHQCIDILVNNAGITKDTLMLRMSEDDFDSVVQTNLSSAFYFTKAILQPLTRARWGRIINMSSCVGLMGNAGQINYSASKAGLHGLTKSLAREVGKRKITVNAIAPGFIQTDMTDKLTDEQKAAVTKNIPLNALGDVDDIANMATFLASDLAKYITGQVISIDGGMVM